MISQEEHTQGYTFVTVSELGSIHLQNNLPNQDAVSYKIIDCDFTLVVSDGVGTCPNADIGAKRAVEAVQIVFSRIKQGISHPERLDILKQIIQNWKGQNKNERIDDYCATLKAVMKLGNKFLFFSIGDGLLTFSSDGFKIIAPSDNTLFLNQTHCLNEHVAPADFWTDEILLNTDVPYTILLCTDGVTNGILEGQEIELVHEIEKSIASSALRGEVELFIKSLAEVSSDDRTIGVVKYE